MAYCSDRSSSRDTRGLVPGLLTSPCFSPRPKGECQVECIGSRLTLVGRQPLDPRKTQQPEASPPSPHLFRSRAFDAISQEPPGQGCFT